MITLEQVKLLESKVVKAIDLVKKLSGENLSLKAQLEAQEKRAAEIEGQNRRLKAEQSRIEEGILLTLEKLNQFEDAVEQSLKGKRAPAAGKAEAGQAAEKAETGPEKSGPEAGPAPASPVQEEAPGESAKPAQTPPAPAEAAPESGAPVSIAPEPEEKEGEELDLF
jgi:hypothetical protein